MVEKPNSKTMTATELAAVLGVTRQRVGQLASAGVIPRARDGSFELFAAIQSYLRNIKRTAGRPTSPAAERVATARAIEIERRNARTAAELIEVAEVAEVLDRILRELRENVAPLAARFARDAAMRAKIDREIADVFRRADDRLERGLRSIAATGEHSTVTNFED